MIPIPHRTLRSVVQHLAGIVFLMAVAGTIDDSYWMYSIAALSALSINVGFWMENWKKAG